MSTSAATSTFSSSPAPSSGRTTGPATLPCSPSSGHGTSHPPLFTFFRSCGQSPSPSHLLPVGPRGQRTSPIHFLQVMGPVTLPYSPSSGHGASHPPLSSSSGHGTSHPPLFTFFRSWDQSPSPIHLLQVMGPVTLPYSPSSGHGASHPPLFTYLR